MLSRSVQFASIYLCLSTFAYSTPPVQDTEPHSYENAVYFVNWAIYDRTYYPQQLPAGKISTVFYAFANYKDDGTVFSSDPESDVLKHNAGFTAGLNVVKNALGTKREQLKQQAYGCVEQLNILKRANRNMKVILSIGGWNYSLNGRFASAVSTDAKRAEFARSAVALMKDWGFDGIDVDWEYPATESEAENYLSLLKAIRVELDAYATKNELDYHFLLTAAVPAGPEKYKLLNLAEISKVLDTLNLMGYDYAGTFSEFSGHQANLYPDPYNIRATSFSTDKAVSDYVAAGVPIGKLCLGMPVYGRSFDGTDGPGQTYTQPGTPNGKGNWEIGTWDYNVLPKVGAGETYDETVGATYSYDPSTKEMISYDTTDMVRRKVRYIKEKGMGGSMFWEASGDRSDSGSLIGASFEALGSLKQNRNNLKYADSQYENIARG